MPENHDYEAGLRDGQIISLKEMQLTQNKRLDSHDRRLSILERVAYSLCGIIALMQFWPAIARFFMAVPVQ